MDAYSSSSADTSYSSSAPVLLAGSSGSAMRRAEATIEASGLRIGAKLLIDEALDRLKVQASAKAVWIELDRDCGEQMDEIIRRVNYDVSRGFYAAVVSVTGPLVDPVSAQMDDNTIDVLIDANEAERTAALALAVSRYAPGGLSDVGRDPSAERLRQLSALLSRLRSTAVWIASGRVLGKLPTTPYLSATLKTRPTKSLKTWFAVTTSLVVNSPSPLVL